MNLNSLHRWCLNLQTNTSSVNRKIIALKFCVVNWTFWFSLIFIEYVLLKSVVTKQSFVFPLRQEKMLSFIFIIHFFELAFNYLRGTLQVECIKTKFIVKALLNILSNECDIIFLYKWVLHFLQIVHLPVKKQSTHIFNVGRWYICIFFSLTLLC